MSPTDRRGDPAKTMDLLWGTEPTTTRPGPAPSLRAHDIVTAAIGIADAGGLSALSMRSVAGAVGVTAMALYAYVPSKDELIELMVDRVVAEQPLPSSDQGWRAALERCAREALALYGRHPWLLGVATSRTVFGPGVIAQFDAQLGATSDLDLDAADRVQAIAVIGSFTRGAAHAILEAEQAAVRAGQTDDDWWATRSPLLAERLRHASFPHIDRAAAEGGFDQADEALPYTQARALADFEFGLERLLDGISLLEQRTRP